VPAWNAAATLPACLASISRQTEVAWECIVVDDGSTDETGALAAEAASRDPRFRVVATPHRGLVAALNEGLDWCRAPLVARMDADDLMHSNRLAAQARALERDPSLAAVGCHVRLFPRDGLTPRMLEYEQWLNGLRSADDISRDAYVECPVAHPAMLVRKDRLNGGYQDRGWPEDYDLVLRLLAAGHRIGVVPRRLLCWRDHPGRQSRVDERYGIDRFTACKAAFLANGYLAASPEYVLWGYGGTGKSLRRALAVRGRTPSHIVEIKPGRLRQVIHGAPVIPISELPALRGQPLVVSVARASPRAEIRAALAAMGFVEGSDYICAA
jgi:glycosyltransferase involved in cell wall biosynthesis